MRYMLLIYSDEQAWKDGERDQCYMESTELAHELKSKGQFLGTAPLQPVSAATSVRVRNGRRVVTDGPFAETREQLGGRAKSANPSPIPHAGSHLSRKRARAALRQAQGAERSRSVVNCYFAILACTSSRGAAKHPSGRGVAGRTSARERGTNPHLHGTRRSE